jgi:hypothetical protein
MGALDGQRGGPRGQPDEWCAALGEAATGSRRQCQRAQRGGQTQHRRADESAAAVSWADQGDHVALLRWMT